MPERRYTDEEVAAIFAQAAESERATLPATSEISGSTLASLQEIGREVGISPELIAHAARSLDASGKPTSRAFLGLPIGVGRTVEFNRPLTDTEWELLVSDLRETFDARGNVKYDGPFRQWTNGNLQALLEPTATGQRLRLKTMNGSAMGMISMGLVSLGIAGSSWIALTLAGTVGKSSSSASLVVLTIAGVGLIVAGALRLPRWLKRRRTQIDAVTARLTAKTVAE